MKLVLSEIFVKPVIQIRHGQTKCYCRKNDIPKLADALGIKIKG